jgi:hypothetical protein
MTPDLPELPFIPESNELRIRLLAWGRQCYSLGVEAERERAAKVVESFINPSIASLSRHAQATILAAEIRKELK